MGEHGRGAVADAVNEQHRGQIDKYTWIDYGSSYLPSDMNAAYLLAELEEH